MPEFHADGGAGEQVDLELFACLIPAHQFARDELGIAGDEARDEQVGAVADVLGRGAGVGDPVGERGVTDAWVHEGRFRLHGKGQQPGGCWPDVQGRRIHFERRFSAHRVMGTKRESYACNRRRCRSVCMSRQPSAITST